MEHLFQEQLERIDRLMEIIEADDPYNLIGAVTFYDCVIFTCQSIWHLKDWVLNDPKFGAKDRNVLKEEIHSAGCLMIVRDITDVSKHLKLTSRNPKASIYERSGIIAEAGKGIFKELYYVVCDDKTSRFHGIEIRELLRECRNAWQEIIDKHHLSIVDEIVWPSHQP